MDLARDVVFGHEFCCEILDYGPGTPRRLKPGTRVCSLPALLTPEGPARHRLFQRQCRRLCRAHAAQRGAAAGGAQWACGGACGADRAAGGRRPCGRQSQCARRRGAAGDRLRPGRAGGDRGAETEGPAPDRRRRLFAGAPRAGAKARRRHRGRSRARAALRDLGRARRDVARTEGGAAAACRPCCRR